MNIEQNISLGPLTTFRIGGPARFYVKVETVEELKVALAFAGARSLPVFVLGGGSNILVSDQGFPGMVIHAAFKGIVCDSILDRVECVAHAGEVWDDVVATTVEKGFSGLENLSFIPGTVGGAVVQNIGAYGSELKDVFVWADVFDVATGQIRHMRRAECDFDYRSSFFKTPVGRNCIVIKAGFALMKNAVPKIEYKDLQIYFSERNTKEPTIRDVRDAVIAIRTGKLPDLSQYGTAGSFFKNPIVDKSFADHLVSVYPGISIFPVANDMVKISAGWIIDHICKLKGFRNGDAGVFENQALVLVNHGHASADDINKLAQDIVKKVFDATGITLEREVESMLKS